MTNSTSHTLLGPSQMFNLTRGPSDDAARARASRWATIVTVFIVVAASHAPAAAESSVAVEADASAFALGGYSLIVRASRSNGLDFAVGTGRYRLPSLFLKGQDSYDEAGWRATSEAIQVARVGYRWRGPHTNGPTVGAIVLNQLWHIEASETGGSSRFKTLGIGVNTGYYVHLGSHFYLYPTASITFEHEYGGASRVGDLDYAVSRLGYAGSIHVGWEL